MPIHPDEFTHGTAMLCDEAGVIVRLLFNELEMSPELLIGKPFPQIVAHSSMPKALSFVFDLQKTGRVFGVELDLELTGDTLLAHVAGIALDKQLLIMMAKSNGAVNHLFDEMMRINNEQSTLLRSAAKYQVALEKKHPEIESRHFDELTGLNNEMHTLQRELAKKNFELERLYAEVQRLSVTDTLTGLLNRRGFFDLGTRELERSKRFGDTMSSLMFDLDHFKSFNDTYGHAVGDEVLQEVGVRCTDTVRQIDILGRYGGEEFAVFLSGTDIAGAQLMGERLRQAIDSKPFETSKGPLSVSISVGVAAVTPDIETPEQLLQKADTALYKAKEAGRNCVRIAD